MKLAPNSNNKRRIDLSCRDVAMRVIDRPSGSRLCFSGSTTSGNKTTLRKTNANKSPPLSRQITLMCTVRSDCLGFRRVRQGFLLCLFCPNGNTRMLSSQTIETVKKITPLVAANAETIARRFYTLMFEGRSGSQGFLQRGPPAIWPTAKSLCRCHLCLFCRYRRPLLR